MRVIILLLFASLLWGQLGSLPLVPGVTVYLHDIVLFLLFSWTVYKTIVTKRATLPMLVLPILSFVAVAGVSLLLNRNRLPSSDILISSLYIVRWILYACLYGVVVQRIVPSRLWLWCLYGTGIGFALLGLAQYILYPSLQNLSYLGWDPHYYRVFSSLLDPNFTGILLVLTLLLGVGFWETYARSRVWIALGQIISFYTLLLTYSRSSFLALIAGGIVWVFIRRQWRLAVLMMIFFVSIIPLLPQHGLDVLQWNRKNTTVARIGNWNKSILLIADSSIIGYGFNTLRYVQRENDWVNDGLTISKAAAGVDSSILFIWATTGVIGFFAYGYIWYRAVRMAADPKKSRTPWGAVYFMSLVAIAVHSLFVNSAFYPWVLLWFWILTGVVESIFDT